MLLQNYWVYDGMGRDGTRVCALSRASFLGWTKWVVRRTRRMRLATSKMEFELGEDGWNGREMGLEGERITRGGRKARGAGTVQWAGKIERAGTCVDQGEALALREYLTQQSRFPQTRRERRSPTANPALPRRALVSRNMSLAYILLIYLESQSISQFDFFQTACFVLCGPSKHLCQNPGPRSATEYILRIKGLSD